MSTKEKTPEQTVVMPPSSTGKDVFTVTALRNALDQVSISAHQKKLILEQLIIPPPPAAAAAAPAPSASTVPNSSAVTTLATDKATAVDMDVNTTHGSDNLMDDKVDALEHALAYGNDDDDDDDSGYDGNVQYPYNPQSKIQYDSDEDSVEDFEFSQQVNFN